MVHLLRARQDSPVCVYMYIYMYIYIYLYMYTCVNHIKHKVHTILRLCEL